MVLKKLLALSLSAFVIYSCSPSISNNKLLQDANNNVQSLSKPKLTKPVVISIPSPNKNARPTGTKINTIVLHHTASRATATNTGKFFTDPASKVSAHYTIDRTGYIVQSVADNEASWHAGKSQFNGVNNVNDFSLGIEICNVGDNIEPYSDIQYDSIIKLVAYLSETYNIPTANITRHRDVAIPSGRKTDTSNNFSMSKVIDGVKLILQNEYNPKVKAYKAFTVPQTISITTDKEMTFEDIADIYLDNDVRANEILFLNPTFKLKIPKNSLVKIPTDYNYFYELKSKK